MYKAIFIDLDGTLLDDQKNVSKENIEAIKKAEENGINVFICSGRQKETVKEFKLKANIKSRYIISSNGSEIYDLEDNEVIFSSVISKNICNVLYKYAQIYGYVIRLDTKYGRYCNNIKYKYSIEMELREEDLEEFLEKNDVIQISLCTYNEMQIDNAIEFLKKLNRSDLKIENRFNTITDKWELWAINIINKSSSKGNALNGLCKFLKINPNEVIAVGDDKNDISMIKAAGLGIAMNNALDEVKVIAKEVTSCDNNKSAIAEIINNKIL